MGTFASFILWGIVGIFCYSKVLAWYEYKDVDIMSSTMENYFDFDYRFNSTSGLFVAAAITEFDSNTEIIEKPEMGELIIEHYGWGYENTIGSTSFNLDYHYCTDEELGIEPGPNTIMSPMYEGSLAEFNTYRKKFKCIDNEQLNIWGDYNS